MRWIHILLIAWLVVVLNSSLPGKLEGYLFPVVSKITVDKTEPHGKFSILFWGHFTKIRNCTFEDVKWVLVDSEGNEVRLAVTFMEGEQLRVSGNQSFGPWKISISAEKLKTRTRADVYHTCHALWITKTSIYP